MFEFPEPQGVLPDRHWMRDLKDTRDRLIWISRDLKLTVIQDDEESNRLLLEYTSVFELVFNVKKKSRDYPAQFWTCSELVQATGKTRVAKFWIDRGTIYSTEIQGTNADEVIEVWSAYCVATSAAMERYIWKQSSKFSKNRER